MHGLSLLLASAWVAAWASVLIACPPTPAPTPVPSVTLAVPAAQAFASAAASPLVASPVVPSNLAVQPILVPGAVQTFSVLGQPAVAQSLTLATVPAQAVVACASRRCRTGLLTDLRLARQAGRTARRAVLNSRWSTSTAVSQAIAVQRN